MSYKLEYTYIRKYFIPILTHNLTRQKLILEIFTAKTTPIPYSEIDKPKYYSV